MLTTPILKTPIKPFDATLDYHFIFYVNGGTQVLRNNMVIEDAATGLEVYNITIESFSYGHTLPANTLMNGKKYAVKIKTGGIENKWSDFSELAMFFCRSEATINITNIDYANQNRVYNQTVNMQAEYIQKEGEQLSSYRFLLFNSNGDLIQSFSEQFYGGSNLLEQEVAGLENGALYYIQVRTESVNGLLSDSIKIWFRPFYVTPRLSAVITPENIKKQGAIKLSANIVQIVGTLYDSLGNEVPFEDIAYMPNGGLDLTDPRYRKLVFKQNFKIQQSDFLIKLWCDNIPDNEVFLQLFSKDGRIDVIAYNGRVHAYKTRKGLKNKSHFISDVTTLTGKKMIAIKQTGNLIDLIVKDY